jgi:hypothetical protein
MDAVVDDLFDHAAVQKTTQTVTLRRFQRQQVGVRDGGLDQPLRRFSRGEEARPDGNSLDAQSFRYRFEILESLCAAAVAGFVRRSSGDRVEGGRLLPNPPARGRQASVVRDGGRLGLA